MPFKTEVSLLNQAFQAKIFHLANEVDAASATINRKHAPLISIMALWQAELI